MVFPNSTAMISSNPSTTAMPNVSFDSHVATAGEALIDMIVEADGRLRPCHGGAVLNMTRALGVQGIPTLYLNPLSRDGFGRSMAGSIAESGVTLAYPEGIHEPTSLAIAELDAEGKASYSFYRDGVADRQVSAPTMNAHCAAAPALKLVATGCLALVPDDQDKYLPWLQAQRAAGRIVVVDANLRPAIVPDMAAYRASVMGALGEAHLIKASDDDLVTLGFDTQPPLAAAKELLAATRAGWLALTLGAKGAMLIDRAGHVWQVTESAPVKVADTVGAGDCFIAGLVAALLERPSVIQAASPDDIALDGTDVEALLARAVASASLCVQRVGCVPPTRDEVAERLRLHPPVVTSLTA